MGLILDSSVLVAAERGGESLAAILSRVKSQFGEAESALSVITVVELTHGIYRARTSADQQRRRAFVDELCQAMAIHPVNFEVAQLAGRVGVSRPLAA